MGTIINIGLANSRAANFLSDVYCGEELIANVYDFESSHLPSWIKMAIPAYHDPEGGIMDVSVLNGMNMVKKSSIYHDIAILLPLFRVKMNEPDRQRHLISFEISTTVPQTPRTKVHPAHDLSPNESSRVLAHVLGLCMRNRLLTKLDNNTQRMMFDATGFIGVRDVFGMLPTYATRLEAEVFNHYRKLRLGLFSKVCGSTTDNCRLCSESLNVVDSDDGDMLHSAGCIGNRFFIDRRHNLIRDYLVDLFNKKNDYCVFQAYGERMVGWYDHTVRGEDVRSYAFSDVTVMGELKERDGRRHDFDVTVSSCVCASRLHSCANDVLDAGVRRKRNHYTNVEFDVGVDEDDDDGSMYVEPLSMTDCGGVHAAFNSLLYNYVNSVTAPWKDRHILNSLRVQSIRAHIARIAMKWTYYGHDATLPRDVCRVVPRGRENNNGIRNYHF